MEKQHPIGDLMTTTMQKLREIADVNTIVGKPILAGEITIIPISKLTVGFASGGSDFTSKNQKPEDDNSFGGGSGAVIGETYLLYAGDVADDRAGRGLFGRVLDWFRAGEADTLATVCCRWISDSNL